MMEKKMSEFKRHGRRLMLSAVLPFTLLTYAGVTQADPRHGGYYHGGPGYYGHYDSHYHPSVGVYVNVLPPAPYVAVYGHSHYYYSAGVWYRPYGPRFVVVAPPIGIVIPYLPTYYDTRVVAGATYYVSDGTYYQNNPGGDGYVVATPPQDAAVAAAATTAPEDKLFIYPRNGQSQQQQDKDRYECHSWAMDQSGFDPTQAHGGVSADQVGSKSVDYHRAISACLDGRGYTVK
jgi:hypothetical protein